MSMAIATTATLASGPVPVTVSLACRRLPRRTDGYFDADFLDSSASAPARMPAIA